MFTLRANRLLGLLLMDEGRDTVPINQHHDHRGSPKLLVAAACHLSAICTQNSAQPDMPALESSPICRARLKMDYRIHVLYVTAIATTENPCKSDTVYGVKNSGH
jgi:hypothetical protein